MGANATAGSLQQTPRRIFVLLSCLFSRSSLVSRLHGFVCVLRNLLNRRLCRNNDLVGIGSRRRFSLKEDTETANWDDLTPADFERLSECGYVRDSFVKQQVVESGHFSSLFCYYLELDEKDLTDRIEALFRDPECTGVFRIKGYMHTKEGRLIRINATREAVEITDCDEVQDVLILIGEALDASAIRRYFPVQ